MARNWRERGETPQAAPSPSKNAYRRAISIGFAGWTTIAWEEAMKSPTLRVLRTRSSSLALRSPLTRHPLGSAQKVLVLVAMFVGYGNLACASAPAPNSGTCLGPPVELGRVRASWLGFKVVGPDGMPIPGFAWRHRRDLILPSSWSPWEVVEGEECRRFHSCGEAGITDQDEGLWEIEVCPPGHRPLHGYIDLRYSAKGLPPVLKAPLAE
jgi:hypothetical protein